MGSAEGVVHIQLGVGSQLWVRPAERQAGSAAAAAGRRQGRKAGRRESETPPVASAAFKGVCAEHCRDDWPPATSSYC